MTFIKNRILLIVTAVAILLLALGFYVFGLVNKETKSEVLTNDTKPPVEKEVVVAEEDVPTLTLSPATGAEALTFFFLISAGILGSRLRKYSHS